MGSSAERPDGSDPRRSRVARVQGAYYTVSGVWPLVSLRSFEAVLGPKTDRWLVQTVAGLTTTIGAAQLASGTGPMTS